MVLLQSVVVSFTLTKPLIKHFAPIFNLVGKIKQTLGNAQLSSSFFDAFSIDRGFNSFNNKIIPGFD